MTMVAADRISDLHTNITDIILSRLPLRDAVRTSILSNNWRHKWTTIPSLVFIPRDCYPLSPAEQNRDYYNHPHFKIKLFLIINRVLSQHTGSIQVFKILYRFSRVEIDPWIARVSPGSIKVLTLHLDHELPGSLYTCVNLVKLTVKDCTVKPHLPHTFKGFISLKNLILYRVGLTDDVFESLISGCPLLENLTYHGLALHKHIKINAPKLKHLELIAPLLSISFGDAHPQLSYICLEAYGRSNGENVKTDLTQFFAKLPIIGSLVASGNMCKNWSSGIIPERLRSPCFSLHTLRICINLKNMHQSLTLLCILISCPNLTALNVLIDQDRTKARSRWPEENRCGFALDSLRTVSLNIRFRLFTEEKEFIRFVLMSSPALEKMYIRSFPFLMDEISRETMSFRKASTRAEIVIEALNF